MMPYREMAPIDTGLASFRPRSRWRFLCRFRLHNFTSVGPMLKVYSPRSLNYIAHIHQLACIRCGIRRNVWADARGTLVLWTYHGGRVLSVEDWKSSNEANDDLAFGREIKR